MGMEDEEAGKEDAPYTTRAGAFDVLMELGLQVLDHLRSKVGRVEENRLREKFLRGANVFFPVRTTVSGGEKDEDEGHTTKNMASSCSGPRSSQGGRLSAVRASATVVGETEAEVEGKEGGERKGCGWAGSGRAGRKAQRRASQRGVARATPGSSDRDGSAQIA